MATNDKPAQKKKASRQTSSRAFVTTTIELKSHQSQHIHKRVFEGVARSLYSACVILPIKVGEEAADQVKEIIVERLKTVSDEMTTEVARMKHILSENGIDSDNPPAFSNPVPKEVRIDTPYIATFTGLLRQIDEVAGLTALLWLNGLITDRENSLLLFQRRQRIMKTGTWIIGLENRASLPTAEEAEAETQDDAATAEAA